MTRPWLIRKQDRTLLLVDGSNLHATTKLLGWFTDFKKLIDNFDGTIFRSLYFTALPPANEQSSLRPMVDWLAYNGWDVYTKETKEYINSGAFTCSECDHVNDLRETKIKGNLDCEITVMAMEMAPYVTDIVLFSGDGDFTFLVESLKRRYGIRVTVVSSIVSKPPMCSDLLRRAADQFVDLADIRHMIERSSLPQDN